MDIIFGEYIWQCVITAVVSGAVGFAWGIVKDKKHEHDQEQKDREKMFQDLIETNKALVEWKREKDEDIRSIFVALDKISAKMRHIAAGGLSILRDRIIQGCIHFNEQGHISIVARENIKSMHDSYKEFGGNGICDTYYNKMLALPLTEDIFKTEGKASVSIPPRVDIHSADNVDL